MTLPYATLGFIPRVAFPFVGPEILKLPLENGSVYDCTFRIRTYYEEAHLAIIAFKSRSSDLRAMLKVFKLQFDDLTTLRRYEPSLRRLLFLNGNPQDQTWRAEALHQLALMHEANGNIDEANKYYQLSMTSFGNHEALGLARVMRDYGLYIARYHDPEAGLMQIKQALMLHDDDFKNKKGYRQRRITESYEWRARLLLDSEDRRALNSLIEFALTESHDCSLRDQQQVIEFLFPYVKGVDKQLLDTRLIAINARRRNVVGAMKSMAKLVIDTELMIIGKVIRTVIRKE